MMVLSLLAGDANTGDVLCNNNLDGGFRLPLGTRPPPLQELPTTTNRH